MWNTGRQHLYFAIVLMFCICNSHKVTSQIHQKLPNILLVVTDDQDVTLHGMLPMRNVQRLVGDRVGATFTNAFTTSPLCCPSRASILSGMYAHNHKTTNNSVSGNCYGEHWRRKVEPNALPVALQKRGYSTFFAGKYLNQYHGDKVPPGWQHFFGLHGNSRYYNYTLRENAQNVTYNDVYLTDLLRDKLLDFLDAQVNDTPFFAMIATPAPHEPFTPAERHRNAFAGIKALRTPNFNRLSRPLEKHWLVGSSRVIPQQTLSTMDIYFQQRWETLLAVDELVALAVQRLEKQGQLQNTYVVYTSDNGYHIGQFAQPFDKRQPYETDIRIPLLVRGPGVPGGISVTTPVALIDLLPTLFTWAQLSIPDDVDGTSLHTVLADNQIYPHRTEKLHRSILIQHWGEGNENTYNAACPWTREDLLSECTPEADCHCQDGWNNTYACIRHFRDETNRLYCEFRDNENFVEAFDLNDDPYQMVNLGYELLPIERALYSLALANLTHCTGVTCNDVNI